MSVVRVPRSKLNEQDLIFVVGINTSQLHSVTGDKLIDLSLIATDAMSSANEFTMRIALTLHSMCADVRATPRCATREVDCLRQPGFPLF
jgi:nicotinamidase-related amidase